MGLLGAACVTLAAQAVLCFNVSTECDLTASQLEEGLRYNLKPLAGTFVEIEEEFGINSAIYASIVALESGWGRSDLSESKNNITSHTCSDGYKEYQTKEDCLWDMAKNLSENYLSEDGKYYCGTELEDVVCFYLIGKEKDEMNSNEKDQIDNYVETVKGIYAGIMERSSASIDNQRQTEYNNDNNTEGGQIVG